MFGESDPLKELENIQKGVASELIRVECLRTADRYRLVNSEGDDVFSVRLELIHKAIDRLELVRITPEVLQRASQPFPTSLGTLDAIHLATCLLFQERALSRSDKDIVFCTHDKLLARAALSMGLDVLG